METPYIEIWKQVVEEKMQWGKPREWRERKFISLSNLIREKSNILISPHTLKRLFHKIKAPDNYMPQPSTLDALAQFLDYESWLAFEEAVKTNKSIKIKDSSSRKTRKISPNQMILLLVALILIVFTAYTYHILRNRQIKNVSWQVEPLEVLAPNTISVKTNVQINPKGRYVIRFNDHYAKSESREGAILKNKQNINHHYFAFPGIYSVELFHKNKQLLSQPVVLYSDHWMRTIVLPEFIRLNDLPETEEWLSISAEEIAGHLTDLGFCQTAFDMITDFNINPDSCFSFSAEIKNHIVKDNPPFCNYLIVGLGGDKNTHYIIKLSDPKCHSYSDVRLGQNALIQELTTNPKGQDFSEFRLFTLKKHMDTVSISIDHQDIIRATQVENIGDLKQVTFNFSTTGEVRNIVIKEAGKIRYQGFIYPEKE